MLNSVFQNSKSALVFAGAVVVSALMLVGPKEGGGVLDKAVTTYKDERAQVVRDAANTAYQMSSTSGGSLDGSAYGNSVIDETEALLAQQRGNAAVPADPVPGRVVETRRMMLSDLSQEPALPEGMVSGEIPSMRNAIVPPPDDGMAQDSTGPDGTGLDGQPAPPREAVVTSRIIRIEPK